MRLLAVLLLLVLIGGCPPAPEYVNPDRGHDVIVDLDGGKPLVECPCPSRVWR